MPNIFIPRDLRPNMVVGLAVVPTGILNGISSAVSNFDARAVTYSTGASGTAGGFGLGNTITAPSEMGPGHASGTDPAADPARRPYQVVGVYAVAGQPGWAWHKDICGGNADIEVSSQCVLRLGRVTHAGKSTTGGAIRAGLRIQEHWARLPRITIHLGM